MDWDPCLSAYVELLNKQPGSFLPLTLMLPGGAVVGTAVSTKEYWAAQGKVLAKDRNLVEERDRVRDSFLDYADDSPVICLRDASINIGGTLQRVGWWRCRLSEVSGFAIGT